MRRASRRAAASGALAGLLLVSGCTPGLHAPATPGQRQFVIVQVCMPDRRAVATEFVVDATEVPEEIAQRDWEDMKLRVQATGRIEASGAKERSLVTVRNVRPGEGPDAAPEFLSAGGVSVSQGVGSDGSSGARLDDVTGRGQPVYLVPLFREPGEVLAVHVLRKVTVNGKEEPLQYWYPPPRGLPREGYTGWMPATYQAPLFAPAPVRRSLFAGKALPAGPVDANAPRVRYMAIGERDYRNSGKARTRALRMQHLGSLAGVDPVVAGPRPATATIPGC